MKIGKQFLAMVLSFAMLCTYLPTIAWAEDAGYISVYTIEDLYNIRDNMSANYILMNDIDLTEATAKGGDYDFMGNGWNPIGSNNIYDGNEFSGVFDGGGHKITGLRIQMSSWPSGTATTTYIGLFSNITGTVRNLSLSGDVKGGRGSYIGAIAGKAVNIMNCFNSADVSGGTNCIECGGLAGSAGNITNSANTGNISYWGGTTGDTQSSSSLGGLAGSSSGDIKNSYNNGDVTGTTNGIYTYKNQQGSSTSRYHYLNVSGLSNSGRFTNCYNTGNVSLTITTEGNYGMSVAGISNSGTKENCYNVGMVTGCNATAVGTGTSVNCYYLQGSGASTAGATSLTEGQFQTKSMFKNFDFDTIWTIDSEAEYKYPTLQSHFFEYQEAATEMYILSNPEKTEYIEGEELDLDGLMIEAVMITGNKKIVNVTADMVTGYDKNTVGEQTVKITYLGIEVEFKVAVTQAPKAISIMLLNAPVKKQFPVATAFDFTGASVLVNFDNGKEKTVSVTEDMVSGLDIKKLGAQTATVTYGGLSTTFTVTVVPVQATALEIVSAPAKTTYLEGQELDSTGMELALVFNDGRKTPISEGFDVEGYASVPGNHTVTVDYNGYTATFSVTVLEKTITNLELICTPTKRTYIEGQPFDGTDMVVRATFDNGTTEDVTDYEVNGFDGTAGVKIITVTYGGKEVSFTVNVNNKDITELVITKQPLKRTYIEGEEMNLTGLVVAATYTNGITEPVSDYTITGFITTPGSHTVYVSYMGMSVDFTISVEGKQLDAIAITAPVQTSYHIGDKLNTTGLKVVAKYNNGVSQEVTDYQVNGFTSKTAGTKTVYVSYGGFTKSFIVNVLSPEQSNTKFTVESKRVRPGEKFNLDVYVTQNEGFAGVCQEFTFNASKFEFVTAECKDFGGTLVVNDESKTEGTVTVVWFDSENKTADGICFSLVFKAKNYAAAGKETILFAEDGCSATDAYGNLIVPYFVNGTVEVLDYWLGDLDGDREFAVNDLLLLAQVVSGKQISLTDKQKLSADVNEDGLVDIRDITLLSQWIVMKDI